MGAANTIRRELDDAGDLLTGEDAAEYLMTTMAWDTAKRFSELHNALLNGKDQGAPKHQVGQVTKNPLYRREDLLAWAQSNQEKGQTTP